MHIAKWSESQTESRFCSACSGRRWKRKLQPGQRGDLLPEQKQPSPSQDPPTESPRSLPGVREGSGSQRRTCRDPRASICSQYWKHHLCWSAGWQVCHHMSHGNKVLLLRYYGIQLHILPFSTTLNFHIISSMLNTFDDWQGWSMEDDDMQIFNFSIVFVDAKLPRHDTLKINVTELLHDWIIHKVTVFASEHD